MSLLTLNDLAVRRGGQPVLDRISLRIGAGEFVGLIGPNGAGKTTLLRAALGLLPFEGRSSLADLPVRARARAAAYLPQSRDVAWPVTVTDLVRLGRLPHLAARETEADRAVVTRSLDRMGLLAFQHRNAQALSGGELARVMIARVLAQDTPLILADEPAAGLDPENQIRSMQVFAALAAEGHGILASVHDLGLAARHCTRLLLLHQGRLIADGPPETVLSDAHLAQVFGIRVHRGQADGGPVILPLDVVR